MDLQKFIERATPTGILGVKITQNGEDLGKHLWDEECRRNVYSVSKSFTGTAVGIAVREGLLTLEEKLVDAFAEDIQHCLECGMNAHIAKPIDINNLIQHLQKYLEGISHKILQQE